MSRGRNFRRSRAARTGHELFQYLFQFARSTDAPALLASSEPGAIRSSAVDDHGKANPVHCRISMRNPPHLIAHICNGKEAHPRRSTDGGRRNGGTPKKIILAAMHSAYWVSARVSRVGF